MNTILLDCGPNVAGIDTIHLIRSYEVTDIPEQTAGAIASALTLEVGASFVTWEPIPGTIEFKEDQQDTDAGPMHKWTLGFRLSKDKAANRLHLDNMQQGTFVLMARDGNKLWRLLGSPQAPARIKVMTNIEGKGTMNYIEVQLYGADRYKAPHMTSAAVAATL